MNITKHLGTKKIDIFTPSRLDGKRSVEEIVGDLKTFQSEGLFSYIGLSEVKADTLQRACKVRVLGSEMRSLDVDGDLVIF